MKYLGGVGVSSWVESDRDSDLFVVSLGCWVRIYARGGTFRDVQYRWYCSCGKKSLWVPEDNVVWEDATEHAHHCQAPTGLSGVAHAAPDVLGSPHA